MFWKKSSAQLKTHKISTLYKKAKIKQLVTIAYLTAITSTIARFHLSVPIEGIEIKLDLGDIVFFIAIGTLKFSAIAWAVALTPIIDNLIHGHNLIVTPFEIVANLLVLTVLSFVFQRILLVEKRWWQKFLIGSIVLVAITPIKIAYNLFVAYLVILEHKKEEVEKLLTILVIISSVNFTKYSVIIYLTISMRQKLRDENWKTHS